MPSILNTMGGPQTRLQLPKDDPRAASFDKVWVNRMFDDQHSPVEQKSFNKTLPSTKVFADSDIQASFNRSMPAGGLAAVKRTRDELPSAAPSAAASSVARSDDEPDELSVPIVGNWTTQPNKENHSTNHSNRQTSTRQPSADQHQPSPPSALSARHTGSRRATAAPREHDEFEDSASKNFGNVRNQGGFSSAALFELQVQNLIASHQVQLAVTTTAPMGGLVRCYIKRIKGMFGTTTSYQMHSSSSSDQFLLAARKQQKSKSTSFVISQDSSDLRSGSINCIGKLKANFIGSEYVLWTKRMPSDSATPPRITSAAKGPKDAQRLSPSSPPPKKALKTSSSSRSSSSSASSPMDQDEALCIDFKPTADKRNSGPRVMRVAMPAPGSDWEPRDQAEQFGPEGGVMSNIMDKIKNKNMPCSLEGKLAALHSKLPTYDSAANGYTLDFKDRKVKASTKNAQLVNWEYTSGLHGQEVIFQLGKIANDTYALDFAFPLTIMNAFSIALACMDTKLCYTL